MGKKTHTRIKQLRARIKALERRVDAIQSAAPAPADAPPQAGSAITDADYVQLALLYRYDRTDFVRLLIARASLQGLCEDEIGKEAVKLGFVVGRQSIATSLSHLRRRGDVRQAEGGRYVARGVGSPQDIETSKQRS